MSYVRSTTGVWHTFLRWTRAPGMARCLCGTLNAGMLPGTRTYEQADHLPIEVVDLPKGNVLHGHFCRNCARAGKLDSAHELALGS